jgi:hypothetical protein
MIKRKTEQSNNHQEKRSRATTSKTFLRKLQLELKPDYYSFIKENILFRFKSIFPSKYMIKGETKQKNNQQEKRTITAKLFLRKLQLELRPDYYSFIQK